MYAFGHSVYTDRPNRRYVSARSQYHVDARDASRSTTRGETNARAMMATRAMTTTPVTTSSSSSSRAVVVVVSRRRGARAKTGAGAKDDEASSSRRAHDAFLGTWTRDATQNQHVVAYLVAHGVGADAVDRSRAPYEQTWTSSASGVDGEFTVRTTSTGTDRTLTYPIGSFVEKYEKSAIFGKGPGEVTRVASFDASTRTHEVKTESSLGRETTTRAVSDDGTRMTCVRRFVANCENEINYDELDVTSVERFVRAA
jgi:hypothetical protein